MSQLHIIHLALFDETTRVDKQYEGRNRELLSCIDDMRKREEIHGIMVVVESGSFTSTRIAVVVANTWSYAKQIPLFTITQNEIKHIQDLIPKLLAQPKGHYMSATYSGEPNIGK